MKILLAGIPLGRNNVGDEAILAGVVRILRDIVPRAEITVSTDDPATATRLQVRVCPLYGFDVVPYDPAEMQRSLAEHDVIFWSGATGLSDYPEIPCALLRQARSLGKKTVIWNVGMNSELNPAKYAVHGRRRRILSLLERLTLGAVNPLEAAEKSLGDRARAAIRETVEACDLVVTRDPQSREEVLRCGVRREVIVGADSALVLEPFDLSRVPVTEAVRSLLASSAPKVGICISAQREIQNESGLLGYLDGLTAAGCRVLFLPMNPQTDARLMTDLGRRMKQPEATALADGRLDPEDVLALAEKMDVIVASRLHLLILASICHVPILGISRGSKVDNFLAPFGIRAAGSVESCDFAQLRRDTDHWLDHRAEFRARSQTVRQDLLARLETAKTRLREVLG